ncbi:MAG: hypothetical protein J0M37_08735 [Ignavibacteria bacterium]|nr:hypothetical protein [Ignavibacteria bacterium]
MNYKLFKYSLSAVLTTVLVFVFSSCTSNPKLQGKWSASGNIGDSTDMHSWFLEYEFNGRNYTMKGYPPISEEGTFEVVQEKGDSLQIYFNVIKSSPETKSHKDWIVVNDSVLITGQLSLRRYPK